MPLVTKPFDFIMSFNEPSSEVSEILPNTSAVHSFSRNVPSICETVMTSIRRKMKKSVQFRTVTIYYFPRAQGYSSIPSQDGPTLGMSDKHVLVETYDLTEKWNREITNNHLHLEHLGQGECPLRPSASAKLTGEDNLLTSVDPLLEDPGRVFLSVKHEKLVGGTMHPVTLKQRRKLLRDAGVSKIDTVEEAETREIRISRTLCGCNCKGICRPDTCFCIRSEIPCQVDSGSFPCACSEFGCGNPSGRLQFDLAQVKRQRVQQLAQLQIDNTLDRGNPDLDVVNVELVISPAKRTKLSKSVCARKRVVTKKRTLRRENGKRPSTRVSEKLEMERLLERDAKTMGKEAEQEMVQHKNSFNDTDKMNASSENGVASCEEQLFTKSKTHFREPVQERWIESALEFVGAFIDALQNEPNSTSIEDVGFLHETTSCSRVFGLNEENDLDPENDLDGFGLDPENDLDPADDLDLEDDLDLNCLKLLVIGNENLQETTCDTHPGAVGNFELRDDLGFKYLGSIRESVSKPGFSQDSKNDLQSPVDFELKCEVIESNNDHQSTDDLNLDLKRDVSLDCRNPWPTVGDDIVSKSAAVASHGIQRSDIVETGLTKQRDLDAVSNDLHSAFDIDSAHSSFRKSNEQSFSCRSFLSRFLPNHLRKTGDSNLASQVTKSSEACIKSQGPIVDTEGHITESQSHCTSSKVESQSHHVEFQDDCVECQGHLIESQGHRVESQGHWNVLNAAQVTGVNSPVSATCPGDGNIRDVAAESSVEDIWCSASPFEVVTPLEVSSTSEEVSGTQSSTLEEDSSTSKGEDSSPSQNSGTYESHINFEDDLTVVTCAGSLLEAGSVVN